MSSVFDIPTFDVNVRVCAMNIATVTACRAPGSPKAALAIGTVLAHVAHATGQPLLDVMERNFPKPDPTGLRPSAPERGHFFVMWREQRSFG